MFVGNLNTNTFAKVTQHADLLENCAQATKLRLTCWQLMLESSVCNFFYLSENLLRGKRQAGCNVNSIKPL